MTAALTSLSDEALLIYYKSIRRQIASDVKAPYRLMGADAKAHATALLAEIRGRGMDVEPLNWPDERAT